MANNPVTYACAVGTWTKVADAVTTGTVYLLSKAPTSYLQTIRTDGSDAPTDISDAAEIEGRSFGISSDSAIDVYIMAIGAVGKVRVDL